MSSLLDKYATPILRLAGWLAVAAIAALSLVPGEMRPHASAASGEIEHVVAYAGTAALLALGYLDRVPPWFIGVGLTGYAALLELLQNWVPARGAKLLDIAVSAAGAWAALGLIAIGFLVRPRGRN